MNADGTNIIDIANISASGVAIEADGNFIITSVTSIYRITAGGNSNRVAVKVLVNNIAAPTAIATQVYAGTGTLANLTATGTAIKWHATVSGNALANTTALVGGTTYYASQTFSGCESPRTAVTVRKISEASQTLCGPATVANLVSTPSSSTNTAWFTTASGGIALTNTTAVATGTYYVEQQSYVSSKIKGSFKDNSSNKTDGGVDISNRVAVSVVVNTVNNEVTLSSGVLTATQTGATYQWYKCPNTLLTSETNQNYSPTTSADYKVAVTINGCTQTSACISLTTLENTSFDKTNFRFYPNPTSDIITVDSSTTIESISVLNLLGQLLFENKTNSNSVQIDLSNLLVSTYFVKVKADGNEKIIKVLKQ